MNNREELKVWRNEGAEIALLDCTGHHFPKHYHDDYVLGVNLAGYEKIWLDGKQYEAGSDELTLYNPGEMQSSSPLAHEWKFISIYFNETYLQSHFGFEENIIFEKSVMTSGVFAEAFRKGCLGCLSGHFDSHEIHEFILLICDGLLRQNGKVINTRKIDHHLTIQMMEKMLDELPDMPRLRDISDEFSLTPVQMVRIFKKNTGISPFQWLKMQRLHAVKNGLFKKKMIADLAFKYGFSDQAHLTRQFKEIFGVTPGAYKKALK